MRRGRRLRKTSVVLSWLIAACAPATPVSTVALRHEQDAGSDRVDASVETQPARGIPTRSELEVAVRALRTCGRPYVDREIIESCEPYKTLLRGRLDAIDLLLDAITDPAPTQGARMTGGGPLRVGDLAVLALQDMVPALGDEVISAVHEPPSRAAAECGECALWDRLDSPGGRLRLQRRLRSWFAQHRPGLVWQPLAGYLPGGRFQLTDGG
jgi:hypothetical protein